MVFSVPFPSGNCFCALFIRRSLGLRIESSLFLLVLDVDQGTNKEQAILHDPKVRVSFLGRPFLLHNSLEKLPRLIIEICYGFP